MYRQGIVVKQDIKEALKYYKRIADQSDFYQGDENLDKALQRIKELEGLVEEYRMETWYYEVVSIDGDYANLRRTDIESDDLKLVARALLPAEIYEGCKLRYELLQYYMD